MRTPGKQYPNGYPLTLEEQNKIKERIAELSRQVGERVQEFRDRGVYDPRKLWTPALGCQPNQDAHVGTLAL